MYVKTNTVPEPLSKILRRIGYNHPDIRIDAAEKVSVFNTGGAGRRAFAIAVNFLTGEEKEIQGSWGGANIGNPDNPVDFDRGPQPVPPNGAIIIGSNLGYSVVASIHLNRENLPKWLPPGNHDLSDREKSILRAFRSLTSAGRKDEFREMRVSEDELLSLIQRNYLKRNSAGATSITTLGKNAVE